MKGVNQLQVNQYTMREIVQYWVDAKFCNGVPPTVATVDYDSSQNMFVVFLQSEMGSDFNKNS